MGIANYNNRIRLSQKMCLALVWIITIYSSVIQQRYFQISNGMLIFGIIFLLCFMLSINQTTVLIDDLLPKEEKLQLFFLVFMFVVGILFAVSWDMHNTQLVNTAEYSVVMILTAYTVRKTGSDSIHALLFVVAAFLALILLLDPVVLINGRYSVSVDSNPNGVGMSIASGIWAVLYFYQKKRIPLVITFLIVGAFGYSILLTGSRKSLIVAIAILVLWLFFLYLPNLRREKIASSMFKILVIISIAVVLVYLFLKAYDGSTMANRMLYLQNEMSEGSRFQLYVSGLEIFKEHPFGIGFQGFREYVTWYSHSTIVEVFVSGGIIGAIIYFSSYFVSIKKTIRLFRLTKCKSEFFSINDELKMLLILWGVILFYCVCIIHPYQYDSFILFAIIFGQTGAIEEYIAKRGEV